MYVHRLVVFVVVIAFPLLVTPAGAVAEGTQFVLEGYDREATDGEVVAQAQGRDGVLAVRIHCARVSDAAFSTIAKWPDLYGVYLHDTAVAGTGFTELVSHEKLHQVTLFGPNVNDQGVRAVSRLPGVTHLQVGNGFRWDGHFYRPLMTDKSLASLARMEKLEYLDIDNANITDNGLRHLRALKSIRSIQLFRCPKVTASGLAELRESLPKARISIHDPDFDPKE